MLHRLVLISSLLLLAFNASSLEIPADKAVIQLTPKFGPVTFNHLKHSQLDQVTCATCHHPLREGDVQTVQPCHDCHVEGQFTETDIQKSGPGTPTASVPSARNAFHASCRGCHARLAKQNESSGPHDSCRDCHK
jgi:hypothetical protein